MRRLFLCGIPVLMVTTGCGGNGPAILEMVEIRGGSFLMGSNAGDPDEQPVHEVHISDFSMAKYEVTQEHYQQVMGTNPSHFGGERRPVEKVTWFDAARFCNALSLREGLVPCYEESTWNCDFEADGYRLPTEAEWEYACRAGTTTEHYWGDADGDDFCWNFGNSDRQTHEVKTRQPNAWGLHDMSGNVWEWCNDWLGTDYYQVSPGQDPPGPPHGQFRVIRGGVWGSTLAYCRSANRSWSVPARAYTTVGLRPVRREPRLHCDGAEVHVMDEETEW